ncbi:RHS repeat-associated core domain-containing protein [Stenotrophomonas sp.]|uniref:RHS repeat-associated core domain-containing protein n=1 Tax=Stenotrophomonas sp. TaxID=69392 RepID=UPI0028B25BE9|nr:RHS repeat-associated core domain-containing protein [Stenotrophomonas sp.]
MRAASALKLMALSAFLFIFPIQAFAVSTAGKANDSYGTSDSSLWLASTEAFSSAVGVALNPSATTSSGAYYYGAPYFHNSYADLGPHSTVQAAISAWWSDWLRVWPKYGHCGYSLAMLDPSKSARGDVVAMSPGAPCRGTAYVYATKYSYQPEKNNGKPCNCVGDPINFATGNEYRNDIDIDLGLLRFERFYNSHKSVASSRIGSNWRHSYDRRIEPLSSPTTSVANVYRPDGRYVGFTLLNGTWTPDAGVQDKLIPIYDAANAFVGWNYSVAASRDIEHYDAQGLLRALTYSNGQLLTFEYSTTSTPASVAPSAGLLLSVTDPLGRELNFTYNPQGRIAVVAKPDGGVTQYTYNATGNLIKVTYPDSTFRQYVYNEQTLTTNTNLPNALTGEIDETGTRLVDIGYDTQGRAVMSRMAGNTDVVNVSYGANGTNTVTYPSGAQVTYGFAVPNGLMRANSASGPCGPDCDNKFAALTFDANGFPATATDFKGAITQFNYDTKGRLGLQVDASGQASQRTTTTTWWGDTQLPLTRTVADAGNAIKGSEAWAYNSRGQVTAHCEIDPAISAGYTCTANGVAPTGVRRWTYTYCDAVDATQCPLPGLLLSEDGPRTDMADITRYAYYMTTDETGCGIAGGACHKAGDLYQVTNPTGQQATNNAYDYNGRLVRRSDASGLITDYAYHARGWLLAKTSRANASGAAGNGDRAYQFSYTPFGKVRTVTNPDGAVITLGYDAAQRLVKVQDAAGNYIQYSLNGAGKKIQEDTRDATGILKRSLQRVFDQFGQVETLADSNANPTDFSYDAAGNATGTTDAQGSITTDTYDALNRLTQSLQDVGGIAASAQFKYDALDNLTEVTDPKGLKTTYSYDGLGQLRATTSPDTGTTQRAYDEAGNLKTSTDARGVTTTYAYDALNRMTSKSYPTQGEDVFYVYDTAPTACAAGESFAIGRLSTMVDSSGRTDYCYNRFGDTVRKAQITNGKTFVVRYTYTIGGNLASVIYPDGAVADYIRDGQGRITEVGVTSGSSGRQVLLTGANYLPFGPSTGWQYGNGRALVRSFDTDYRPTAVVDSGHDLEIGLGYDSVSNITALESGSYAADLNYDTLGRLTEFRDSTANVAIEQYTYDATGNRLSFANANGSVPYTYEPTSHRLSSAGNSARTYDAAGNTVMAVSSAKELAYNQGNRLSQVRLGGIAVQNYAYNAHGERVQRGLDTTSSIYTTYDEAGHWLGDYDSLGNATQQVVWMDDMPVGLLADGVLHYIEPDHLGTPRLVFNPMRNVPVWTWDIKGEAFGDSVPNQDPDGDSQAFVFDMRFPGQRYDAVSGLNYNYYRDYDPSTGRYLQSDPIGLGGGISTYGYAGSNPLSWTDFFGKAHSGRTERVPGGNRTTVRIDAPHVDGQQRHAHVCERGCTDIVVNQDGTGSHGTDPKKLSNRVRDFLRKRGFNLAMCPSLVTDVAKGVAADRCIQGDDYMCQIFVSMGGVIEPVIY